MRISFDMDGVLADMESGLARIAEAEFGVSPAAAVRNVVPEARDAASDGTAGAADPAVIAGGAPAQYPAAAILEKLSSRQQTRLWQRVAETRNFWETLKEHEPGTIRRIQDLAYHLRWDVLFITQRPSTAGQTAQVQTQRWLHKHGFDLPSVYTTKGSRGHIAAALHIDAHIDDRLENAVDIASDSRAWSILVWRDEASFDRIDANARKMNIATVGTVGEALDKLAAADKSGARAARKAAIDGADEDVHSGPALLERFKKTFGFGGGPQK